MTGSLQLDTPMDVRPPRLKRTGTEPHERAARPVPSGDQEPTGAFHVEILEDPASVEPSDPAWLELAQHAIESNSFHEAWFVGSAARWFASRYPWRLFKLWREPSRSTEARRLCGVLPLELAPRFGSWRFTHLRTWRHPYAFLGTPLVRLGYAADFWRELLAWSQQEQSARFLELRQLPGEGPLHRALIDELRRADLRSQVLEEHTRATLETAPDAETYLERASSKNQRRELRRRHRRFEEAGNVALCELTDPAQLEQGIENFLRLEAGGWKGAEQSALALDRSRGEFFTEMATRAFLNDRLELFGYQVDGQPVALKCNLRAGNDGFAFKIAYDEAFARYSPGVQLEVVNIDRLHRPQPDGTPPLRWMDSCAIPDHPMINRLWSERRVIRRVAVSTRNRGGDIALSALPFRKLVSDWFSSNTERAPRKEA